MADPALKKLKLSQSLGSVEDDKRTLLSANALNTSFQPSDKICSEDGGGNTPHLSQRDTQNQSAGHIHAKRVDMYGSMAYNSNMLRLQTEEMLHRIQSSSYDKRVAKVDAALQRIKQIIESIPDMGPLTVKEAEIQLLKTHKVRIPFPHPPPDKGAKYVFSYARPSNINVVGSYVRKTAIRINEILTVDLAVTMPTKLFQEKDYLNYRYFYKRAFYLARIAVGIRESEEVNFHIDYALQNDSHLQPIIIIKSNPSGSDLDFPRSKCQIRILLAADGDLFPAGRTLPHKNCIRSVSGTHTSQIIQEKPTPFYNSSLRSECCSFSYLELLRKTSIQSEAFNDACILGSVWLRQRGFCAGIARGGFGPFEWACTVAMLMRGGGPRDRPILSKGYNRYQIFKAVLLYLSVKDLMQVSTSICYEKPIAAGNENPVLLDGARGMNVLFKMSPWSYMLLRHEASRTLALLSDPSVDQFNACFITKIDDPMQRFDFLACFPVSRHSVESLVSADAYDGVTKSCARAYQVIKCGLDDRALLVDVRPETQSPWAVTKARLPTPETFNLLIGLLLNPDKVNRTVDRGPSAEDKAAASTFRTFWGEKAELRRFKDGSIVESLIWPLSSDQSVLEQIIAHVVRRHLSDKAANGLSVLGRCCGQMLPADQVADTVALYQPMMTAYEVLERQIRTLEGMPLRIHQVSAGDAQMRYTSPSTPWRDSISSQMKIPVDVYVQFEGSSRWPDDLAATQRTKIAFLLKVGELLQGSAFTPAVTTRLGLEDQDNDFSNAAFLDVSYTSGALFRLRVHHERELGLLQRALVSAPSDKTREVIVSALSAYKRSFIHSPLHTQAVRTLCTHFPLLSPSVRLMKKWRESHLLSYHLSDELIELLTIRSFVQPYPWAVPGSVNTGFLRTLTFISNWDWRSEPLIVDFSGDMKIADYNAIRTRFEAWRKIDPAMNRVALFVASNLDPEGISWTELGPTKVIAARLTSLAKAACALVKEQSLNFQAVTLFTPSLSDYDFVIYLDLQFIAKDADGKTTRKREYKNLQIQEQPDPSLLICQPVYSFLEELRKRYGSNVIFFCNAIEGSVIGGLWNPQTNPRSWKVNIGYSTVPIKQNGEGCGQVTINKAATLHDIARLGGDLISTIEERH